jgi:putative ABC transport system permease protein
LKRGLLTAAVGVTIGLLASLWLTRYLQTLVFAIEMRDLTVYSTVTILLLAVAAAACLVPAFRATRVDPMVALRDS